ncbi:MAG: hypothetical protein JWN54_3972 [Mycobacterium sp.]|nr:hypothetical protein [Mycobacterium sp.]
MNRSRLRRSAAVSATVGAGLFAVMAGSPAMAAPSADSFTANGSATLARLDINTPASSLFPAGSGNLSLVRAENTVDSAAEKAAQAGASFISLSGLGQSLPDLPKNSVSQFAPPDNAKAATSSLLDIPKNPLLWGSILPASAHARWNDSITCPTGPVEIANTELAVAKLHALTTEAAELPVALPGVPALPVGDGVTVVDLPDELRSSTKQGLVAVDGQSGFGVSSTSGISVLDVTLFKGTPAATRVQVVSAPELTATAAGTEGKSTVDYKAPILRITDPTGNTHEINAPGEEYEIGMASLKSLPGGLEGALSKVGAAAPTGNLPTLPALPKILGESPYLAKISLGKLTNVVKEANKAQGQLTMLRLDLLSPDGVTPLASLSLGDMRAQATAPNGGVTCGNPVPSVEPSSSERPPTGTLPVTGSDVTLLVAGGGLLLLLGRFAMVATARRQ